jgi:hypothetical protein
LARGGSSRAGHNRRSRGDGQRKHEVEAYARERGAGTSRWRVDEKALADRHGRDDYLSFRITHHFVHGSTFATADRYSQEGDVYLVGGPAAVDPVWAKVAALQAASSVVYATRAVCTIFDWDVPAELDDLHERIEAADVDLQQSEPQPEAP